MAKKRKKKLLIAAGVIVGIGVLGVGVLLFSLNRIAETGVQKGGSAVLDVPVTLDDADVSLTGYIGLNELALGSPEGYEAAEMFQAAHIHTEVDVMSLLSEEIVVREVVIDGPQVVFELTGGKTNWGTLMEGLQSKAKTEKQPEQEPAKKAKRTKMRIDRVLIKNGKVSLANIPMVDKMTVPLPRVEVHDIGKGEEAKSALEVMMIIVGSLYKAVLKAVDDVLPAERLKKIGTDIGGAIEETAGDIGSTGKEAGGSIGDAVGGAAEKGTEAIKGLLGGDKEKDEEEGE